ncbi:FixH family protein [Kordiimonas lipolytica]|uniref:FixH family protein n=1 Tax=Kordiimonas lipolytica TaxID=1662421 RepID=A0ABV8UDY9_9PROT|nr:FixH family protein [Kordiimonas lipolytica]
MTAMTKEELEKSSRWIPWSIVGFFVVLAILDGIFVYLATSTHPGVVTEHAYEEGLRYNETVAAAEKQDALGWQTELDLVAGSSLMLTLSDAESRFIDGASVRAEISRPTQAGMDFELNLEQSGAGTYEAAVSFPEPGQWEVRIFVEWQQKQYQQAKRVVVAK